MKNLILGIVAFSSFSAFANCEVSVGLKYNDDGSPEVAFIRTFQVQDAGNCAAQAQALMNAKVNDGEGNEYNVRFVEYKFHSTYYSSEGIIKKKG